MVDPVNVLFVECVPDHLIQFSGGIQIAAKRFLENNPRPCSLAPIQLGLRQALEDRTRHGGWSRNVKQMVPARTCALHLVQLVSHTTIKLRVVAVASEVLN